MAIYKIQYPYVIVDAPSEEAALVAYGNFLASWWGEDGFGPDAILVDDTPYYAVDADGNEIVEGGS